MKNWRELEWSEDELVALEIIDQEIRTAFDDPNHAGLRPRYALRAFKDHKIRPRTYLSRDFPLDKPRYEVAEEIPTRILSNLQEFFEYMAEFRNGNGKEVS